MKFIFPAVLLLLLLCGCKNKHPRPEQKRQTKQQTVSQVVAGSGGIQVKVLPLGKISQTFIDQANQHLKGVIDNVEVLQRTSMPASAYYRPRARHRADSLINWMNRMAKSGEVYVGVTMQDISTTKGDVKDFGIMGLGYCPGNACVVSSFRLKNKSCFYKVVIHELGHTAGLPHCPVKSCFMRDAKGGDPTAEEKEFCTSCRSFLQKKGWKV